MSDFNAFNFEISSSCFVHCAKLSFSYSSVTNRIPALYTSKYYGFKYKALRQGWNTQAVTVSGPITGNQSKWQPNNPIVE